MFMCRDKCNHSTADTKYGKDVEMPIARQIYYQKNRKWCNFCAVKVQTKLDRCECCGAHLRTNRKQDKATSYTGGRY